MKRERALIGREMPFLFREDGEGGVQCSRDRGRI